MTRYCRGRCRLCGWTWIARDPVAAAREHLARCLHTPVTYVEPQPRRIDSIWQGTR